MATNLEIERKFLVQFPKSWSELAEMFNGLKDIKRITQTYLKPKGKDPSARVRKTVEGLKGDTNTVFHYNQKVYVQPGVHEETEYEISKNKYNSHLEDSHPDKRAVDKTRFVFNYNDQTFELDVFQGPLKGLAILEIELEDKDDKVELPPFLKIIREVTEEKKFTNYSLADRK